MHASDVYKRIITYSILSTLLLLQFSNAWPMCMKGFLHALQANHLPKLS